MKARCVPAASTTPDGRLAEVPWGEPGWESEDLERARKSYEELRGRSVNQARKRMVELLREICASGIIMQPSENDLASPEVRPYLDRYMRGKDVDVEYKARLFRLAHDLAASSYGLRQNIYEYWHGGDPNRNRINLLRTFDQGAMRGRIREMLSRPQPHGSVP